MREHLGAHIGEYLTIGCDRGLPPPAREPRVAFDCGQGLKAQPFQ